MPIERESVSVVSYALDKHLVVLAGAGLGGLARFVASTWIMEKYAERFPLGTFVINITGSFLIGVLMMLLTERWQVARRRLSPAQATK